VVTIFLAVKSLQREALETLLWRSEHGQCGPQERGGH
jgi:hypothetical protein